MRFKTNTRATFRSRRVQLMMASEVKKLSAARAHHSPTIISSTVWHSPRGAAKHITILLPYSSARRTLRPRQVHQGPGWMTGSTSHQRPTFRHFVTYTQPISSLSYQSRRAHSCRPFYTFKRNPLEQGVGGWVRAGGWEDERGKTGKRETEEMREEEMGWVGWVGLKSNGREEKGLD